MNKKLTALSLSVAWTVMTEYPGGAVSGMETRIVPLEDRN